jgi:hypothetical protein
MDSPPPVEPRLRRHFSVLVYPFRHALTGRRLAKRLHELDRDWQPWWGRLGEQAVAEALDDTFFFLPYVRTLLFPEVGGRSPATLRSLTLDTLTSEVPEEAVLRLTCTPDRLRSLQSLQLDFERLDDAGKVIDRFSAPFDIGWIDLLLFPHQIGFLLLKVQLAEDQPPVQRLNDFLYFIRLVQPPAVGWQLATWRARDSDAVRWHSRDLVDFLLQGLTEMRGPRPATLKNWLGDPSATAPEHRFTATPFGQVSGQVFHLYTYACLAGSGPPSEGAAAGAPLATPGERILYELATCTQSTHPDFAPHRSYLRRLWRRNRAAFWANWQGLVLHDNAVFLGMRESRFLLGALPHNVEADYLPMYLYALFQKTWLSVMFGDMVQARPRTWWQKLRSLWDVSAARRLMDHFILFQNRFWFVEVTRKPLPVELYRLFQHGLGVEPLYRELAEQVHDLETYYEQRLSRRVSRITALALLLGWSASVPVHLFGYHLVEQGLWPQAALVWLAFLGALAVLWVVWTVTSRD